MTTPTERLTDLRPPPHDVPRPREHAFEASVLATAGRTCRFPDPPGNGWSAGVVGQKGLREWGLRTVEGVEDRGGTACATALLGPWARSAEGVKT